MTLKQLIKDLKLEKEAYISSYITKKNYPKPKEIRTDYKVLTFDRVVTTQEVVNEAAKQGCRPVNAYEFLAWAKDNWDRKSWAIGLGELDAGGIPRGSVYLYWSGSESYLGGDWYFPALRWRVGHVFPVVSNKALETSETGKSVIAPLGTWPLVLTINGIKYRREL
jgi:hypothetical protein